MESTVEVYIYVDVDVCVCAEANDTNSKEAQKSLNAWLFIGVRGQQGWIFKPD